MSAQSNPDHLNVAVGQTWRHREGKRPDLVKVNRVWDICGCDSYVMHAPNPEHGADPVEALNVVSGRTGLPLWWTLTSEFLKRYELVAHDETRAGCICDPADEEYPRRDCQGHSAAPREEQR